MSDGAPKARVCRGCGKPKGCIPFAGDGYWHLRCYRKHRATLTSNPATKASK